MKKNPSGVIDFVVHELAHLHEPRRTPGFLRLVEPADPMEDFVLKLRAKYSVRAIAIDKDEFLELQVLEVPSSSRGRGIGTAFMAELCIEADRRGVIVGVSPEGTNAEFTERLEHWYKRHGFHPNHDLDRYPISWLRTPNPPSR